MSETKFKFGEGLSFFDALTLIFIALKLAGYIAWSWWWVLAPLWIPLALLLVVFVCCMVALSAIELWDCLKGKS